MQGVTAQLASAFNFIYVAQIIALTFLCRAGVDHTLINYLQRLSKRWTVAMKNLRTFKRHGHLDAFCATVCSFSDIESGYRSLIS